MVKVEGRRIVRAPVQKVFQLISRLDAAPRVTGLWLTADLVERKPAALTIQYRGYFAGLPVESLQRATLYPPHRIDFRQTRGGLKAFRGQYLLKPVEGDTEVSLVLEAEPGIPFITEQAARLVLHAFIERSLEKVKLVAERELPRVVRRAGEASGSKPAPFPTLEPESSEPITEPPPAPPAQGAAPATNGQAPPAPQSTKRRRRRRRRRGPGDQRKGPGGEPGSQH
jgi:ribosome-associated toxin RatA of RatAB toxin-antitoxin module